MREIVMDEAQTRHAVKSTVAATGFTLSELKAMADVGSFKSEAARRVWVAVGDLLKIEEVPDPCDPPCGWVHRAVVAELTTYLEKP